jgi:fructokinase
MSHAPPGDPPSPAPQSPLPPLRLGIDLGGTKIAGVALAPDGAVLAERRISTPRHDYAATLAAIAAMVASLEDSAHNHAGGRGSVGVGMPGSVAPASGLVQNANSTWLNGRPLVRDLEAHLGRPVRVANDANCFALSEAVDGAGSGAPSVLGVILGTGCGSGVVINGRLVDGPLGIGGEWGHNPLPWPTADELPGPSCWCGSNGCLETWVSGPALEADHLRATGCKLSGSEIATGAGRGDAAASATLRRHADRLARGLAHVMNILDPHVVVLGGGLSGLAHLYEVLPELICRHLFTAHPSVTLRPPRWGDAGGVRGAAWLWGKERE